MTYAHYDIRS